MLLFITELVLYSLNLDLNITEQYSSKRGQLLPARVALPQCSLPLSLPRHAVCSQVELYLDVPSSSSYSTPVATDTATGEARHCIIDAPRQEVMMSPVRVEVDTHQKPSPRFQQTSLFRDM